MLHKHCNLNKWEIFNYTLPQITELLKKAQKNIRFEIEASMAPLKAFMGGFGKEDRDVNTDTETDITDEDLDFINAMGMI